jgi:PAS domain S-box-containing protein
LSIPIQMLIVEDSEDDALLILVLVRRSGLKVESERIDSASEMHAALKKQRWDIIIADYSMPNFSAPAALEILKEYGLDIPFIIVSGIIGEEAAVAAMKAGARDYIKKDNLTRLIPAIERELREAKVRQERQRAEEALRLMKKAIETTKTGISITDADGKIVFANSAEAEMHGYSLEEVIGKDFGFLSPPEKRERMTIEFLKEIEGGVRESIDIKKNGKKFPVYFNSSQVLDERGELIGIVTTREDVTERKRAELELKEAYKELRELDELKNNFLSNISHELRTPLVSIEGYIELLLKNSGSLEQNFVEWLERSHNGCLRLKSIIEDLLDVATLHHATMIFDFQPVEFFDVLQSCVAMLQPQFEKKEITVEITGETELPLILADHQKIRSVVINILQNACKFSPDKTCIKINMEKKNNSHILISFEDQGIGIAEKDQGKVFTRFFQVDSSSTRSYSGSGIGLALVKEITEAHNGIVSVLSTPGEGSKFLLSLPIVREELLLKNEDWIGEESLPTKAADGKSVLIVDDDPYIREFISTLFRNTNYRLIMTESGEECLNKLETNSPDLILLDIAMPNLNGIEVCRIIKNNPDYHEIPVYMLSAGTDSLNKEAAEKAGANGFIEKPFSIDELFDILGDI